MRACRICFTAVSRYLEWLKNLDLTRRANARLNKGEARNALARAIFFYRIIADDPRDRSFESQVYRASGLNLLIAPIILSSCGTRYLQAAFVELQRAGFPYDYHAPGTVSLGAYRSHGRLCLD